MRVFTSRDHDGVWMGGCSVVVAADETRARELLDALLTANGLKTSAHDPHSYTLVELPLDQPLARMLDNGDY